MTRHLVLGAGGIGTSTALALTAQGHTVDLVSRSGRGPDSDGIRRVSADVTDPGRLAELARGASSIVNALNPARYWTWPQDWPPMARAIHTAAERSGARLVTVSNLYLYGQVDAPMTEETPVAPAGPKGAVRAQMWVAAKAAPDAGRVQATEVRASDYIGPHTLASSVLGGMVLARLIQGRNAWLPMGRRDVPHSWTYDGDVAALVATLATTDDEAALGRPWHVPTAPPATVDDVVTLVTQSVDHPLGRLRATPRAAVTVGGAFVPILRELRETRHQLERPWVLDGSAATARFGLTPTPLREALEATVDAIRK